MALSTRTNSPRQTIGVTRARQGRLGRNVLWVLIFGLLLVIMFVFGWAASNMNSRPAMSRCRATVGSVTVFVAY